MTLFLSGIAILATLAEAAPARAGEFATRLIARLEAGDADSARALVTSHRAAALDCVGSLLGERVLAVADGGADSAAADLRAAQAIAILYAAAFADSFCLRAVGFYAARPAERLAADAAAWRRAREVEALNGSSNWRAARTLLPGLRSRVRASGDPYLEERVEHAACIALYRTGAVAEAREAAENAAAAARRLGDEIGGVLALEKIARTDLAAGRLDDAVLALGTARDAARRLRDDGLAARAVNDLGFISLMRGDLDSAVVRFEEAIALARAGGSKSLTAEILTNMGAALGQRGEPERAMASHEEALRILGETGSGNAGLRLSASIFMVSLCTEMEQYSRAIAIIRDAMPVAEQSGIKEAAVILQDELANTQLALGRQEEALQSYRETLALAKELGVSRLISSAYRSIGLLEIERGDLDEAVRALEQSVATIAHSAERIFHAMALCDLGDAYRLRGDFDRAEARLLEARGVADSLGNPFIQGNVERSLGLVLASRGDASEALPLFDSAIRRGRAIGATAVVRDALVDKAALLTEAGNLAAADSLLAEAIDLVESVRGRQLGDEIRVGFLSDMKSIYAARIGVLSKIALTERAGGARAGAAEQEAFRVAELAKGRSLLDALAGSRVDPGDEVEPALRARERTLAARLSALQTVLSEAVSADSWDPTRVDSLERAREATAREHRATIEEIAVRSPSYDALSGNREPLDVVAFRERVLSDDQVLLEYFVGAKETFLFVVGERSFRMLRIPAGADSLAARVAALRGAILGGGRDEGGSGNAAGAAQHQGALREAATGLHALLVAPAAGDLPRDARLLIVPDGPLFYLPFEALHDGTRHLVESHAIAYAPSASVLDPDLDRRTPSGPVVLLAMGNPSSFRAGELLASVRDVERWRFGELPFAADEVKRIARRFRRATTLTGAEATEEAVKAAVGRATYIHFATHGLLDEEEPTMSGLALAQDEDPAEDGILQAHEILKLRIPAGLVVLSACNTGLGRIAGGEGVLGLTRAFQCAGARALLISLWEVGDRSTADLMDRFYDAHLTRRLPADVALQTAQIAAIRAGRPPREWAPFVLTGRVVGEPRAGRPRIAEIPRVLLGAALFAALILLALLVRLVANRSRRGSAAG